MRSNIIFKFHFRHIADLNEVPDMAIPMIGAKDIRSMSYDSVTNIIYWVDYGNKKHSKKSINWISDNGTLTKKNKLLPFERKDQPNSDQFMPYDIEIDPYNRFLFWNDESTNVINIIALREVKIFYTIKF